MRVYEYLKQNDIPVSTHEHDRNMSNNKYIMEATDANNKNDTLHCVKAITPLFKTISSRPLYTKNSKWSDQLHNKVEPIATHFTWAIKRVPRIHETKQKRNETKRNETK